MSATCDVDMVIPSVCMAVCLYVYKSVCLCVILQHCSRSSSTFFHRRMTIVLVPSLIVFLIINRCYEIHPNGAPNTVGVQNCVIIKNVRVTMVVFDAK